MLYHFVFFGEACGGMCVSLSEKCFFSWFVNWLFHSWMYITGASSLTNILSKMNNCMYMCMYTLVFLLFKIEEFLLMYSVPNEL